MQNVDFLPAGVALADGLADVLGDGQQKQLTGNFDISGCQKADKLPVVLQLPEGTLGLDGAVYPKQLAFFRGNPSEGSFPVFGEFPADNQFFPTFRIPGLAASRSIRVIGAVLASVSGDFSRRSVLAALCRCADIVQDPSVPAQVVVAWYIPGS